jgi:hypothetical protein
MPQGYHVAFAQHHLLKMLCIAARGDSRMIDVTVEVGVVMSWRRMGKFNAFSYGKDSYGRRPMCL